MEYAFDGIIFSIILFCFIKAKEPKQTALLVCVFVSLGGYLVNELIPLKFLYSTLAIMESIGAIALMFLSFGVSDKNRKFFYLMIGFLMVSVLNNGLLMPIYKHGSIGSFAIYTYCYQTIAIAHVLTMLAFSDVIRNTIRSIRDNYNIGYDGFRNLRS